MPGEQIWPDRRTEQWCSSGRKILTSVQGLRSFSESSTGKPMLSFQYHASSEMRGCLRDSSGTEGERCMARRQLLTDEERRLLLGVPRDPDALARHYTFTRSDQDLVAGRHGATNRLGFAVQLALLRHPGVGLAQMDQPVDALVIWLAAQLEIPAVAFVEYAARSQTMTDHARELASTLGLRLPTAADLPSMIEAAAQSAWS